MDVSLVGPITSLFPNLITRILSWRFLSINTRLLESRDKISQQNVALWCDRKGVQTEKFISRIVEQNLHRDIFCDDISLQKDVLDFLLLRYVATTCKGRGHFLFILQPVCQAFFINPYNRKCNSVTKSHRGVMKSHRDLFMRMATREYGECGHPRG